jgi:hypothetical protein
VRFKAPESNALGRLGEMKRGLSSRRLISVSTSRESMAIRHIQTAERR